MKANTNSNITWKHTQYVYDANGNLAGRRCDYCTCVWVLDVKSSRPFSDSPAVKNHLLEKHNYVQCDICDSVIKKSGLKAHKKSHACEAARRQQVVSSQGFTEATGHVQDIISFLKEKVSELTSNLSWDDYEAREQVRSAYHVYRTQLIALLGIRTYYTAYYDNAWRPQHWVPDEVHTFLDLLRYSTYETYASIWRFAEATAEQRQVIITMLELARGG